MPPTRHLRRFARVLAALTLTGACGLAVVAPAQAEVRTARLTDGADPTLLYDIAEIGATFDREAATATVTVDFHAPLPASGVPYGWMSVSLVRGDRAPLSERCGTAASEVVGDLWLSLSVDLLTNALQARARVSFRQTADLVPATVTPDRRRVTVTIADPLLAQADPRCLTHVASGRGASDPAQPGGGPDADSGSVWFDGQAPPPRTPDPPLLPPSDPPPAPPIDLDDLLGDEQICSENGSRVRLTGSYPPVVLRGGPRTTARVELRGDARNVADVAATLTAATGGRAMDPPIPFALAIDAPARVTLAPRSDVGSWRIDVTWSERTFDKLLSNESAWCRRRASRTIPIRYSREPRFASSQVGNTVSARWAVGGPCTVTRPRSVTVTASGTSGRRTFRLGHPCGSWSWSGSAEGLRASRESGRGKAGAELWLLAGRQAGTHRFRLVARSRGRTIARRTLVTSVQHWPAERIWAGTDAFVNYCINRDRRVWSSGGRLYCVSPAQTDAEARLRP